MSKNDVDLESKKEKQLNAMLAEYNMLRDEMKVFLDYHRRNSQIFAGIIGVLITVYLSSTANIDTKVLSVIIPSSIFLFYMLQIFNFHMVSMEAKACARLENKINKLLDNDVMDWESVVARNVVRGAGSPIPLATGSILIFFIGLFIVFAIQAYQVYAVPSLIVHAIEFLAMLISTILWAILETRKNFLNNVNSKK